MTWHIQTAERLKKPPSLSETLQRPFLWELVCQPQYLSLHQEILQIFLTFDEAPKS